MNLSTHLGGHASFCGFLANSTTLGDVVGQWLFAIDMFFHLQRWKSCKRMCVLAGANDDGIKVPDGVV